MTSRKLFEELRKLECLNDDDDETMAGLESSDDDVDSLETESDISDSDYDATLSDSDDQIGLAETDLQSEVRSRQVLGRQKGKGTTPKDPTSKQPPLKWTETVNHREMRPFSERTGVQKRFWPKTTSLNIFSQFFTENVISLLCDMTNLNAERKLEAAGVTEEWKPTNHNEMKAFLGLTIIMGLIKMPQLTMYWQKKNWIFDWHAPNKIMSRDRFKKLWKYLHFCDESSAPSAEDPSRDRLYKIRPLIELIEPTLLSVYTPSKNISIDESMIPFKGKLSFRQFIPSKRVRFGIKVWVLAESKTGYVSKFQVYTGRDQRVQEVGLASRVVDDLIEPFLGKGYHLYVDNFYTSPDLFRNLYEEKTYACGTLRLTRKNVPRDIIVKKRSHLRGTSKWRMSDELLCQSWLDNRPVYFLSTIHYPEHEPGVPEKDKWVKRRGRRGKPVDDIPCPPLLHDYNNYMGGVDFNDAMRKYYNIGRRSNSWYRRIFFYIVEVALHNSAVVAKAIVPDNEKYKFSSLKWRKELVTELIGGFRTERVPPRRSAEHTAQRIQNVGPHLPHFTHALRICKVCSAKESFKKRKPRYVSRTRVMCNECNVHLCVARGKDCFIQWHTKVEFWR
uniref:piggyBac transposable element-derived protein 4-like n=1 Tax=Styela clava TaxID=7725 RepID=UPI00193AB77D|nr:piggyBac transposable element-derived protein 4-like [Styela clava]